MPTLIRPMRAEDQPGIGAVFSASRRAALPYLPFPHSPAQEAAWLADTNVPPVETWVAEQGGQVVGFLARNGDFIAHLYLRPDMRRQGIGTALLEAARADQPARLTLYCFQRNTAARAFYLKHGFRAEKFGDGTGNMESEPDVLYAWTNPSRSA